MLIFMKHARSHQGRVFQTMLAPAKRPETTTAPIATTMPQAGPAARPDAAELLVAADAATEAALLAPDRATEATEVAPVRPTEASEVASVAMDPANEVAEESRPGAAEVTVAAGEV